MRSLFFFCLLVPMNGDAINSSCSSEKQTNGSDGEKLDTCKAAMKACVGMERPTSVSIVIRDSTGRLGNHMFSYKMLLSLSEQFGYRTYITR